MTTANKKVTKTFSDEERAAMKERIQELRSENGEKEVLAKIASMEGLDHTLAERLHKIIKTNAPELMPKTWYGFPAYANKDGKVVCFFQDAKKFKTRYATLGFSDAAHLDDGEMWPTVYALKKLTSSEEAKIVALLKKALS